ncbi:hypothetical protein E2C01_060208 [Portunus trituberculatus]|uniref:Uncharacterized protein n=1 Tax=Portunus trituberculatus TaxID=210409 RepID=A0A5B7H8N4_PORTR|nr:hypothetical protein [Portunus trituberculatus]
MATPGRGRDFSPGRRYGWEVVAGIVGGGSRGCEREGRMSARDNLGTVTAVRGLRYRYTAAVLREMRVW